MRSRAPVILLTLFASLLIPIMTGNVYAATCPPGNCQVAVSTNVPSSDGTIWVEIDNNTSNVVPLPQAAISLSYNMTHTITVLNSTSFTGASTSGHYVWRDWANYYGTNVCPGAQCVWTNNPMLRIPPAGTPGGILYNYTGPSGFTAVFDKQYKTTISFTDAKGSPLNPAPSSLTLQGQTVGTKTITSYTQQYISADNYTVTSAHWEGANIPANTQTINLANGPTTATISLKAYPAIIQVIDNNNNPVSGANVTITFVNGTVTSRSYITDHNGNVNLGDIPYPGSIGVSVHYQNQAYGPYSPNMATTPTYTVQVSSGSTTTSTTTAIVLLTIFGIAFFLILLAIKVRKPAPPPRI